MEHNQGRYTISVENFIPDRENAENIRLQAEERLNAARELIRLEFYNDAISRAYYSVFSSVTLLFYVHGKSFSSHKGLITSFHKEYIKTKIFPKEMGESFSELFQKRQDSDYKASVHFTKEEAEASMQSAENLFSSVTAFLKEEKPALFS